MAGAHVLGVSRTVNEAEYETLQADVTCEKDLDRIVGRVGELVADKELCLVNCAGWVKFGSFHETSWKEIEQQLLVNFLGPARLLHAIVPIMHKAGRGHVVNVLSIAARHAFGGAAAYGGSKAGLQMFARCLAEEYRRVGVRFTNISPGSTDTALWDEQSFQPERGEMLPARAVAECIRDVLHSPTDRNFDDILLMPPKGIL